MIINEHHPDFMLAEICNPDGTPFDGYIKSADTRTGEYTRYERDASGRLTGALELHRAKKIDWCWHTKILTIHPKDD